MPCKQIAFKFDRYSFAHILFSVSSTLNWLFTIFVAAHLHSLTRTLNTV